MTATLHIPGLSADVDDTGGGLVCREVREDDLVWIDPGWDRRPAVAGGFTMRVEQFLGRGGVSASGERTVWIRGPVLREHSPRRPDPHRADPAAPPHRQRRSVIAMGGDPVGPDATERMLAAAEEVADQHVPDGDGWCAGCLDLWARLAPYPCLQAEWAAATRAAYTTVPEDTRGVAGE